MASLIKDKLIPKDYSAWYWNFIPHERIVDDYPEKLDDQSIYSTSSETVDKFEYRDEANRPWWKFFDEYEYRFNKQTRSQKSWWRIYDKNMSASEKKLVFKLDLQIVLFAIMSYWSKNLDQANISNAYVSGMKEDLNMQGNDFSNAQALFTAGNVIFQVIWMYLFPRVPMHLAFFSTDLLWSIVTILISTVNTPSQLKALRFLVGAFESGYFIQIHYLLGSCGQMLGTLTSGLVQASVFQNLNGVRGRAGWRWMFLVDGSATAVIAFFALYLVPGTPYKCCSLFLTDDEIRLARSRLIKANIKPPSKTPPPFFNKALWKKIIFDWRIYVLAILDYLFWNAINTSYSNFALWLKSLKRYDIPKINRYTSIPPALGIVWILSVCGSADILKSRYFAIFWAEIFVFMGNVILAKWDVAEGALWYAFMISYFGISVSSVIYGWLNDITRHDGQERSIILCIVNIFANQSTAWTLPMVFRTSSAPRYHQGYVFVAGHSAALMIWCFVTLFFYKRQEKKDAKGNGIILYNSKTGEIPPEVQKRLNEKSEEEISDDHHSLNKNEGNVEVNSIHT
ncbi:putative transporter SEO1 [Wickerhamomyces ciferrii]|uniref:Transporter SEO1 n=1 Tax=Wickerhamomyces ciferrii (strain ATCC 14091 / BCRC 22168 / CBS 111 / JCM 3599 / NBRC 0793 / NRRL Y-1031 F-60-10) TaxID=1206466 RepID=K0KFK7_WICCF|nr:putative transporter SEO1 [Wickerhamomyces ciferrii]CCH41017.1 putative transporter SEO1 [Wickerhamomyces ciferrii]